MKKSHYLTIIIAIFAIALLYNMPRTVVNSKDRGITPNQSPKEVAQSSEQSQEAHAQPLSKEQLAQLASERTAFLNAQNQTDKINTYHLFGEKLRNFAQFDSLAYYAKQLYQKYPSDQTLEMVADAYYEAFAFAMNKKKKVDLANTARAYYQKIQNPTPNVSVKMGVTYVVTSNPMQGISMIKKVLEKNPNHQFALFNLGNLSMQSGQFEKAVARFKRVIALNNNDLESHLRLAECYLQLNQKEKAIPQLKFVLQNTTDQTRKDAIEKLLNQVKK